jgi:hypothetical protein
MSPSPLVTTTGSAGAVGVGHTQAGNNKGNANARFKMQTLRVVRLEFFAFEF